MRVSRHCNRLTSTASVLKPQPRIPAYIASSMVLPRAGMSGRSIITQMASDMREAAYREGGMTRDGLKLLGYTGAQIDSHADAARVMADQMAALT